MKRLVTLATLAAGLLGSGTVLAAEQTVRLAVSNMYCASCLHIVRKSLAAVPGVSKVAVSYREDPQVASVGFTEAQAKAAGHEAVTSLLSLDNVPRAIAARDTRGLIKLVADAKSRKLLGAHILAPEGADSVQTAAMAMKAGLTVDELAETIFPYLTTVEGLKLAALAFSKDVARLSCCAG